MKAQPFVVTPKDYDPALNVLGIKVTVLASNTATQAYEITRQQGEAGMGPPPHSHNWDESFYVIAGEVEFTCSGNTVVCRPVLLCTCPPARCIAFAILPMAGCARNHRSGRHCHTDVHSRQQGDPSRLP